jgi:hypothetical protein
MHMHQRGRFFSVARQRLHRAPLQEAQNPESKPEVEMEDVRSDDTAGHRPIPGAPIREASTATDEEDADLVYDPHTFSKGQGQTLILSLLAQA